MIVGFGGNDGIWEAPTIIFYENVLVTCKEMSECGEKTWNPNDPFGLSEEQIQIWGQFCTLNQIVNLERHLWNWMHFVYLHQLSIVCNMASYQRIVLPFLVMAIAI